MGSVCLNCLDADDVPAYITRKRSCHTVIFMKFVMSVAVKGKDGGDIIHSLKQNIVAMNMIR